MLEDTLVEEDIHPDYVSVGVTHTGRVRSSNQDAFLDRADLKLWVVADGMGGHMQGDVASRSVCEGFAKFIAKDTFDATLDDIQRRMSHVNAKLYAAAVRPINPVQSGSTVVILAVNRTACAVLWAGDSRAYRLRHGQLVQLTVDHTWAARVADLFPRMAAAAEEDHSILRAVGGEDTLQLDLRRDRVHLGDRYLLCSDGLTREIPVERIKTLLGQGTVQEAAQALLDETLAAGARDNVTIVVVEAQ